MGLKTVGDIVVSQNTSLNRWYELPLPKSLSIVRCAVGHDGLHALFLDSDGTPYFAGLARRGEDGDLSSLNFGIFNLSALRTIIRFFVYS